MGKNKSIDWSDYGSAYTDAGNFGNVNIKEHQQSEPAQKPASVEDFVSQLSDYNLPSNFAEQIKSGDITDVYIEDNGDLKYARKVGENEYIADGLIRNNKITANEDAKKSLSEFLQKGDFGASFDWLNRTLYGDKITKENADFFVNDMLGNVDLTNDAGKQYAIDAFKSLVSDGYANEKLEAYRTGKDVKKEKEGIDDVASTAGGLLMTAVGSIASEFGGIVNALPFVEIGKGMIDAGNQWQERGHALTQDGTFKISKDKNGNANNVNFVANSTFGNEVADVANSAAGFTGFLINMGALGVYGLGASTFGKSMREYELTEGEENGIVDVIASIGKTAIMLGSMKAGGKLSNAVFDKPIVKKAIGKLVGKYGAVNTSEVIRKKAAEWVTTLPEQYVNMSTFLTLNKFGSEIIDNVKQKNSDEWSVANTAYNAVTDGLKDGFAMVLADRMIHAPQSINGARRQIKTIRDIRNDAKEEFNLLTFNKDGKTIWAVKDSNDNIYYVQKKGDNGGYECRSINGDSKIMNDEWVAKNSLPKKSLDNFVSDFLSNNLFAKRPPYVYSDGKKLFVAQQVTADDAEMGRKKPNSPFKGYSQGDIMIRPLYREDAGNYFVYAKNGAFSVGLLEDGGKGDYFFRHFSEYGDVKDDYINNGDLSIKRGDVLNGKEVDVIDDGEVVFDDNTRIPISRYNELKNEQETRERQQEEAQQQSETSDNQNETQTDNSRIVDEDEGMEFKDEKDEFDDESDNSDNAQRLDERQAEVRTITKDNGNLDWEQKPTADEIISWAEGKGLDMGDPNAIDYVIEEVKQHPAKGLQKQHYVKVLQELEAKSLERKPAEQEQHTDNEEITEEVKNEESELNADETKAPQQNTTEETAPAEHQEKVADNQPKVEGSEPIPLPESIEIISNTAQPVADAINAIHKEQAKANSVQQSVTTAETQSAEPQTPNRFAGKKAKELRDIINSTSSIKDLDDIIAVCGNKSILSKVKKEAETKKQALENPEPTDPTDNGGDNQPKVDADNSQASQAEIIEEQKQEDNNPSNNVLSSVVTDLDPDLVRRAEERKAKKEEDEKARQEIERQEDIYKKKTSEWQKKRQESREYNKKHPIEVGENAIKTAKRSIEKQKGFLLGHEKDLKSLNENKDSKEKEIKKLKDKIDSNTQQKKATKELKDSLKVLETELKTINDKIKAKEKIIDDCKDRISNSELKIAELEVKVKDAKLKDDVEKIKSSITNDECEDVYTILSECKTIEDLENYSPIQGEKTLAKIKKIAKSISASKGMNAKLDDVKDFLRDKIQLGKEIDERLQNEKAHADDVKKKQRSIDDTKEQRKRAISNIAQERDRYDITKEETKDAKGFFSTYLENNNGLSSWLKSKEKDVSDHAENALKEIKEFAEEKSKELHEILKERKRITDMLKKIAPSEDGSLSLFDIMTKTKRVNNKSVNKFISDLNSGMPNKAYEITAKDLFKAFKGKDIKTESEAYKALKEYFSKLSKDKSIDELEVISRNIKAIATGARSNIIKEQKKIDSARKSSASRKADEKSKGVVSDVREATAKEILDEKTDKTKDESPLKTDDTKEVKVEDINVEVDAKEQHIKDIEDTYSFFDAKDSEHFFTDKLRRFVEKLKDGSVTFDDIMHINRQIGFASESFTDYVSKGHIEALLRVSKAIENSNLVKAQISNADGSLKKSAFNIVKKALERSGLFSNVVVLSEKAMLERYKQMAGSKAYENLIDSKGELLGFKTKGGKIFLNADKINANTPIHEVAHNLIEAYERAGLLTDGFWNEMEALAEGSGAFELLPKAYDKLSARQKTEECIAMAIGNRGEIMLTGNAWNRFAYKAKMLWNNVLSHFFDCYKSKAKFADAIESLTKEALGERTYDKESAAREFEKMSKQMNEYEDNIFVDVKEMFAGDNTKFDAESRYKQYIKSFLSPIVVKFNRESGVTEGWFNKTRYNMASYLWNENKPIENFTINCVAEGAKLPEEADYVMRASRNESVITKKISEFEHRVLAPFFNKGLDILRFSSDNGIKVLNSDGNTVSVSGKWLNELLRAVNAISGRNSRMEAEIIEKKRKEFFNTEEAKEERDKEKSEKLLEDAHKAIDRILNSFITYNSKLSAATTPEEKQAITDAFKKSLINKLGVAKNRSLRDVRARAKALRDYSFNHGVDVLESGTYKHYIGKYEFVKDKVENYGMTEEDAKSAWESSAERATLFTKVSFIDSYNLNLRNLKGKSINEIKDKIIDIQTRVLGNFATIMNERNDSAINAGEREFAEMVAREKAKKPASEWRRQYERTHTFTSNDREKEIKKAYDEAIANGEISSWYKSDATGITTSAAKKLVADARAKLGDELVDEFVKCSDDVNFHNLKTAYECRNISKNVFDKLKERGLREHYVPIRGYEESNLEAINDYGDMIRTGGAKDSGILIKSEGRYTDMGDIMSYMTNIGIASIRNGMENLALIDTYNWVRYCEENGFTKHATTGKWLKRSISSHGKFDWETSDKVPPKGVDVVDDLFIDRLNGVEYKFEKTGAKNFGLTEHISQEKAQAHSVELRIDGSKVSMTFSNKEVADAFNNRLSQNSKLIQNYVLDKMRSFTQLSSKMMTTWDVDFVFRNFQRDLVTASAKIFGSGYKHTIPAFKWALTQAFKQSFKDTFIQSRPDRTMKILVDEGALTGYKETLREEEQLMNVANEKREMRKEGYVSKWDKMFENDSKSMFNLGKVLFDNSVAKVGDAISLVAESFELVPRIWAARVALLNGATNEQAVNFAKEVTVNFNRHGNMRYNAFGKMWISSRPFINASMQGIYNSSEMMVQQPKKTLTLMAGGLVASFFMQELLRRMFGKTDYGADYITLVSDYQRGQMIQIKVSDDHIVTIPLPHFWRMPFDMGMSINDFAHGDRSGLETTASLIGSLADMTYIDMSTLHVIDDGVVKGTGRFLTDNFAPILTQPTIDALVWNRNFYNSKIHGEPFSENDLSPMWQHTIGNNVNPMFMSLARNANKAINGGTDFLAAGYADFDKNGNVKYNLKGQRAWNDLDPQTMEYIVTQTLPTMKHVNRVFKQMYKLSTNKEDFDFADTPIIRAFVTKMPKQEQMAGQLVHELKGVGVPTNNATLKDFGVTARKGTKEYNMQLLNAIKKYGKGNNMMFNVMLFQHIDETCRKRDNVNKAYRQSGVIYIDNPTESNKKVMKSLEKKVHEYDIYIATIAYKYSKLGAEDVKPESFAEIFSKYPKDLDAFSKATKRYSNIASQEISESRTTHK